MLPLPSSVWPCRRTALPARFTTARDSEIPGATIHASPNEGAAGAGGFDDAGWMKIFWLSLTTSRLPYQVGWNHAPHSIWLPVAYAFTAGLRATMKLFV